MSDETDELDLLGAEPAPKQSTLPAGTLPPAVQDAIEPPEYSPAMRACSEKERTFVEYLFQPENKSAADAARKAGYGKKTSNSNTMARIAWRLVHNNPRIVAAIEELTKQSIRSLGADAVRAVRTIVRQDFNQHQLKAAALILDKIEPPVSKVEGKITHEVVTDHEAEAVAQLRTLMALGVARDKLIEIFGDFGLQRLEAKLEPPIDAEYREVGHD